MATKVQIGIPKNIAVTGRIKDWLASPDKRLAVSCTVFAVDDTMDETSDSIEQSWLFTSKALRTGAGVGIDLSKLRPKNIPNSRGMISSGPVSFAKIYSTLNEILRRGGVLKYGAVVLYLDYDHPDASDFLNATAKDLPWAKKALYVDDGFLKHDILRLATEKVRDGSLFLAKKRWDKEGRRLYSQVCTEILIPHRGTCLLAHQQLGSTTIEEIPQAAEAGMRFLCELHPQTGVGDSGIYLRPEEDKQVGFGALGLASLLAIEGVKYKDFVEALEVVLFWYEVTQGMFYKSPESKAQEIAIAIFEGMHRAARVAREHGMSRAFTIAPCARVFTDYKDREGYTATPEISPPTALEVERDSEALGTQVYHFNPKCETAQEVGWPTYYRLVKAWQGMMESTGLAHAISCNIWDTCEVNEDFIRDWFASPLVTTYYRWTTKALDAQDKTEILAEDFFGFDVDPDLGPLVTCNADDQECSSCAE